MHLPNSCHLNTFYSNDGQYYVELKSDCQQAFMTPLKIKYFFRTEPKNVAASLRIEFISRHTSEYCVCQMCRVLEVSRQGYSKYIKSQGRPHKHAALLAAIEANLQEDEYNGTYGRERLHDSLLRHGFNISLGTVYRVRKKKPRYTG